MALAERFGMRGGGRIVATRECRTRCMGACQHFGIAALHRRIVRGLLQQQFGACVVAALVGDEAIGELRPCLPLAMPLPGTERQPQQLPRDHQ